VIGLAIAIAPGGSSGCSLGWNLWTDASSDHCRVGFGIGGQQGWILQPLVILPFHAAALPLITLVDLRCQPFFHGR